MLILLLTVMAVVFAVGAIRARQLLISAIWLAGASALLSVLFYLFGAHQVAVVELSVGAGLVTVLFVFAISIAGDEASDPRPVLPKPAIAGLLLLFVFLLVRFTLPAPTGMSVPTGMESTLSQVLWQQRGLDVLVQVVLIFSGVLGLLGLLAEVKPPLEGSAADEITAKRDRELQALEGQFLGKEEIRK
jgi:NADH:ubiquinone oxidoreductase subunit 6 (subunit J)